MKFNTTLNAQTTVVTAAGNRATFEAEVQATNEGIVLGAEVRDIKVGAVTVDCVHVERAFTNREICDFEERVIAGAKDVLETGRSLLDRLRQHNTPVTVQYELTPPEERAANTGVVRMSLSSHATEADTELALSVLEDLNTLHKAYSAVMTDLNKTPVHDLEFALKVPMMVSRINNYMDSISEDLFAAPIPVKDLVNSKDEIGRIIVKTLGMLKRLDTECYMASK